jgi:hypothetical protein
MGTTILGIIVIYTSIHFMIIQHSKTFNDRSPYQKVVSVAGMVSIGLIFLGVIMGG